MAGRRRRARELLFLLSLLFILGGRGQRLKDNHLPKGNHFLIELQGCSESSLKEIDNYTELEKLLNNIAKDSGATPLVFSYHLFEPSGITGTLILSESHISLHSYPQYKTIFIDVFTCGNVCKPERSLENIKKYFLPTFVSSRLIKRGLS